MIIKPITASIVSATHESSNNRNSPRCTSGFDQTFFMATIRKGRRQFLILPLPKPVTQLFFLLVTYRRDLIGSVVLDFYLVSKSFLYLGECHFYGWFDWLCELSSTESYASTFPSRSRVKSVVVRVKRPLVNWIHLSVI